MFEGGPTLLGYQEPGALYLMVLIIPGAVWSVKSVEE